LLKNNGAKIKEFVIKTRGIKEMTFKYPKDFERSLFFRNEVKKFAGYFEPVIVKCCLT